MIKKRQVSRERHRWGARVRLVSDFLGLSFYFQGEEDEEDSGDEAARSGAANYTGVSIKVCPISTFSITLECTGLTSLPFGCYQVSFNSKSDEGLRIQQLSGGQKALVALATGPSLSRFPTRRALALAPVTSPSFADSFPASGPQCSPSKNATPRPSTSSTRSTPTSTPSTELPSLVRPSFLLPFYPNPVSRLSLQYRC